MRESPDTIPEVALSLLTTADADTYFALMDENREYFSRLANTPQDKYQSPADVITAFENEPSKLRWGIRTAAFPNELVGTVNFRFLTPDEETVLGGSGGEIGYAVAEKVAGRGMATGARRAAVSELTKRGVTFIAAVTHPNNTASQKVLEKAGFKKYGTNEDGEFIFLYTQEK